MTEQELLYYKMNNEEKEEWDKLSNDIKEGFYSIEKQVWIPSHVFRETLEKMMMYKQPWVSKGYVEGHGFYYVAEGDRGHISVIFENLNYYEAKNKLIKYCADKIAYAYVTYDMKGLQKKYEKQWRYVRIQDGIEKKNGLLHIISHLEEQSDWIYDTEYDYRIYWFEPLLFMVKRLVDHSEYLSILEYYENCMNHHIKNRKWIFNTETEKFELV